jgi:N-methylhydantoinase A
MHGGEPGRRVEIVGLRFGVRRPLETMPAFRERAVLSSHPGQAPVQAGGGRMMARLVDAAGLSPGEAIAGPALIEGYSSSTWVPPGWRAVPDAHGNILLHGTAP